jgi:hypothetical protein
MRLIHIFWALFALAVMILLLLGLFLNKGKLNGGPGLFGTFLIFWWLLDTITPIAFILVWLKKRSIRYRFSFTLLAILNLYFGLMGIFYFMREKNILEYKFSFLVFLLNLTWSVTIVYFQSRSNGEHRNA